MEVEREALMDHFDLETYASKYTARNKLQRLLFVAETISSKQGEALSMLERDVKNGTDMALYQQILSRKAQLQVTESTDCSKKRGRDEGEEKEGNVLMEDASRQSKIHSEFGSRCLSPEDQAHIDNIKRNVAHTHACLEQELNSYKSSMIKESIRMGHNDLGEFYYHLGDLPSALKSFAQARDYCTTDKHNIEMCLNVIKVALHLQNYIHVTNYVMKLNQLLNAQSDNVLKTKVAAVFGLVALHEGKYQLAAEKFISCHIDIGASYNEVLHAEDIALYGGICALATLTRDELRDKVINNSSFKAFLELVPWLREMIAGFHSGKYSACLAALEKRQGELLVDMYLSRHVDIMTKEIRDRAIIQFFYPYTSVNLEKMAKALNYDPKFLEKQICQLISSGSISARIDGHAKVLHAYNPDPSPKTYEEAFRVGTKYAEEARGLLLRMSLLNNRIIVNSK
uniref:COP9 signalosome complex subunit 1 putative n=1 Tax=Albugo laibachii Nc14 TaxID=890382 RepID=F0W240_9STRA|nr:COP9 signalosome complex subunit 1 putative [Albugo laibachii Nc14]|eukprot:CCA15119.1 COP9 signalosome complex subunit 1 putative [Albugo laibachii Nc14]